MPTFEITLIVLLLLSQSQGCRRNPPGGATTSAGPASTEPTKTVAVQSTTQIQVPAVPAEYRTLARVLARPMDGLGNPTKPTPDLTQAIADAHASIMDLRQIHSTDDGINQLASMGIDATEDLTKRIEDFDVANLSKPKHVEAKTSAMLSVAEHVFRLHPIGMLLQVYAHVHRADTERIANAQDQAWKASVQPELAHIIDDSHQLDAAAMLLPKIAAQYSVPPTPNAGSLDMRYIKAWGPLGDDVLELQNNGPDLEDCTIAVELVGDNGESRTNVHWIPKWKSKAILNGRYSLGETILDQTLNRATVSHARLVKISLQSPMLSTRMTYNFNRLEQDKAVAEICKDLKLAGSVSATKVIWGKPTYIASITLDGPLFIPEGKIALTLHRGAESSTFSFPFKQWKRGEAKNFPKLPFNPDSTDVIVTFPDTSYRYETEIRE